MLDVLLRRTSPYANGFVEARKESTYTLQGRVSRKSARGRRAHLGANNPITGLHLEIKVPELHWEKKLRSFYLSIYLLGAHLSFAGYLAWSQPGVGKKVSWKRSGTGVAADPIEWDRLSAG